MPCIEGPPTTGDPVASVLFGRVFRNWTVVVGVSGAAVYGVTALGYERFYGALGFTPQDVGINQTDIITRSAIALGLVVAVLGAILAVSYALVSGLVGGYFRLKRESVSHGLVKTRVGRILWALALTPIAQPLILLPRESPYLEYWLAIVALNLLLTLIIWRDIRRVAPNQTKSASEIVIEVARRRALLFAGILSAAYVIFTVAIISRANELAELTAEGDPSPATSLSVFYNFRADAACIIRDGDSGRHAYFRDYLGESDGQVALFDISTDNGEKLSRDGLVIVILTDQPASGNWLEPTGPRDQPPGETTCTDNVAPVAITGR